MPMFLLIRHGENDYIKKSRMPGRLPGVHLNQKGRAQAQAVADKLSAAPVKAIYSSPMERAQETAAPLAKVLSMEVITRPGLNEGEIGEWTGKSWKSLRRLKIWRIVQNSPSLFRFPGGESFAEVQQRIASELLTLSTLHAPQDLVVCFSHADPIKLAVAYFIGLPLDHFQRLAVAPTSITALHIGETGSHLMTLNYDLSFNVSKP